MLTASSTDQSAGAHGFGCRSRRAAITRQTLSRLASTMARSPNRARCAELNVKCPGTEPQAPPGCGTQLAAGHDLRHRFSCLSRGPDDQGLSCGPCVIIVRERPAGGGSKRLENQERQGRRASPAGCEDRRWWRRAGDGTILQRVSRPGLGIVRLFSAAEIRPETPPK